MKRKAIVHFIFFLFLSILLYGCGGGGGSSPTSSFTLSDYHVSTTLISKSNPTPITFSWKVEDSYSNKSYYLDIYLSRDNKLDKDDVLLSQYTSSELEDNVTLNPADPSYQKLLNAYGGKYYLIFDAYTYDEGLKKESIKYLPNFILKTKWTVMIYMDGDNSLSDETSVDLNEMEQAGSNGYVNIVVQDDTKYDTTKRYFVKPNEAEFLQDMGELNMADKQTLIDFANWAVDNYPADRYILVLWNHGGGFKKRSITTKDICWDDNSSDSMSIPDLHQALSAIRQKIGHKIDIVGMDACLMGMLEVDYEIGDTANFMIGSENTEPGGGWPYDKILKYLIDNVDTSTIDLSKEIVKDYIESYNQGDEATLSAIDLSKIDNLKTKVDNLATDLKNGLKNDNGTLRDKLTTNIFESVQRFDDVGNDGISYNDDSYADLYHLASLIANELPNYKVDTQAVMNAVSNAVIADNNTGSPVANAFGISIWFPKPSIYSTTDWNWYWNHYAELSFAKDSQWDEFITALWEIK